nr:MAG TPA: Erythromycin resistance leader peptide [Caudoviricetes sp.]
MIIRFDYTLLVFHQVLTHSLRLRYVHLSSLRYMFRYASHLASF